MSVEERQAPLNSDVVDKGFPSNILKCLDKLRLQESLCDVAICCGGEKIKAHKVILAAASQYFCAMFTNGMSESKLDEVFSLAFCFANFVNINC